MAMIMATVNHSRASGCVSTITHADQEISGPLHLFEFPVVSILVLTRIPMSLPLWKQTFFQYGIIRNTHKKTDKRLESILITKRNLTDLKLTK